MQKLLNWFFGNIMSQVVSSFVFTGIVVACGKATELWTWPTTIIMGVLVLASTLAIFYVISSYRAGHIPRVYSPSEIQHAIQTWLDGAGWSSKRILDDDKSHFHLVVTMQDVPMDVVMPRQYKNLVVIQSNLDVTKAFFELKKKMTEKATLEFIMSLREQLLMFGVSYQNLNDDLKIVTLQNAFSYGPSMTPVEFAHKLELVQNSVKLLLNSFQLQAVRVGVLPSATPPTPDTQHSSPPATL